MCVGYSVNAAIWTVVEVDLGILCACLPVMRPLFLSLVCDTRRRTVLKRSTNRSSNTVSWPTKPRMDGFPHPEAGNPYANLVNPSRGGVTWTTITAEGHGDDDVQPRRFPWDK